MEVRETRTECALIVVNFHHSLWEQGRYTRSRIHNKRPRTPLLNLESTLVAREKNGRFDDCARRSCDKEKQESTPQIPPQPPPFAPPSMGCRAPGRRVPATGLASLAGVSRRVHMFLASLMLTRMKQRSDSETESTRTSGHSGSTPADATLPCTTMSICTYIPVNFLCFRSFGHTALRNTAHCAEMGCFVSRVLLPHFLSLSHSPLVFAPLAAQLQSSWLC